MVTVAVCTRDRTSDLALCLEALSRLNYPNLELLVVDNAPTNNATQELVQTKYRHIRYVREPRPGLDWARNRAIIEAKGEIIAYTDDDVVVDPKWVKALAKVFAENSEVMAVTGLVIPYELETEAQVLFEKYGGFGRGFERKWYRVDRGNKMPWQLLGTGQFGTGANMAYRKCVFSKIGAFDPALDVGTVTNGCGDLEMFFRVLKEGHTLVYEPNAIVRHRHRGDYTKLRSQIANNGIGLYSYFVCGASAYREELFSFLKLGLWWLLYWHLRRLWITLKHPTQLPRDLVVAEFKGVFTGLIRYPQARTNAAQIAKTFGTHSLPTEPRQPKSILVPQSSKGIAVRRVELCQSIYPLTDVTNYPTVRLFITWNDSPLGSADISNQYQPISATRLRQVIVDTIGHKLLSLESNFSLGLCQTKAKYTLQGLLSGNSQEEVSPQLPQSVAVTINLATYDRPDDLCNCLRCLVAQQTSRRVEIIVVDNHPASGLTPPVVAEFPDVKLVSEPRQGLAYARNAGFISSQGDIVVATDDDVTLPRDWLEKLIAPFIRSEVMVVTGNVLPIALKTPAQQFFETYGGLGRGFEPKEVDGDWLESSPRMAIPTWSLGATANAAFRASILNHPQIGLMEETLGPGMPSGVGEDTYLFYKVLKAGYTIVYEPKAYVWHKHRRDLKALRRQIYGYSKGHVSYNLTTWLRDGDWRGLAQILVALPVYHVQQIKKRITGASNYPISLIWLETVGNLAGAWSLWQSYRRVKREGRSSPYVPVGDRSGEESKASRSWEEIDYLAANK